MKSNYYHSALIIAAVGIFYTNVPGYVFENYRWNVIATPKHWVMLFCLLSLPVLFMRVAVWNALKSPVVVWCFGFALVTVVWFVLFSQSETAWQEVRNRILAIIEIVAFLLVFWDPNAVKL